MTGWDVLVERKSGLENLCNTYASQVEQAGSFLKVENIFNTSVSRKCTFLMLSSRFLHFLLFAKRTKNAIFQMEFSLKCFKSAALFLTCLFHCELRCYVATLNSIYLPRKIFLPCLEIKPLTGWCL